MVNQKQNLSQATEPDLLLRELETTAAGLTTLEAQARLKQYGRNKLQKMRQTPRWKKFLGNFTHTMALLLWAGGIVGFISGTPQLGIAIWLVNVINGVFSFWQEYRAQQSVDALRKILPDQALCLRDGQEVKLLAEDLVPGDVLVLQEGEKVTADARLLESSGLRIDESVLTGESHPVHKHTQVAIVSDHLFDRINKVFAGTTVLAGEGRAVVTATGMHTEFGQIAGATLSVADELSPLQIEMERVTRVVTMLAVGIGAVFFVLAAVVARVNLELSFIFAMGMIVAFVPEGMLPTVTLALAMGVQRMAKRNALVKRLSSVETLGCTTVICTDKTGTLTCNQMTVTHLWTAANEFSLSGEGYTPDGRILFAGEPLTELPLYLSGLLKASVLCTNTTLVASVSGAQYEILGDPTEAALLVAGQKAGLKQVELLAAFPLIHQLPFDAARKCMTTVHQQEAGFWVITKGALQEVLQKCNSCEQGKVTKVLTKADRIHIEKMGESYARQGLRVLAVAQRAMAKTGEFKVENIEQELTFVGLVAMIDPPRPEVLPAIQKCHRAGIRVIMMTGDDGLTASSIARKIGICQSVEPRVITGTDLVRLSDAELAAALKQEVIFARMTPALKLKVVTALQAQGHVVAVTGDGVNDAPALKKADIGIAMGLSGTDVAKDTADMILSDDNFASIVAAVEEGRAIYDNIRKFATYVFTSNMPEAVPYVLMLFSRGLIPLPLTLMQILSIDLGTDMLPAIALGAEKPQAEMMQSPPRTLSEPLLNKAMIIRSLLWLGIIESVAAMAGYFVVNWQFGFPRLPLAAEGHVYAMATTMVLTTIVACQIGNVLSCRSERQSIFTLGIWTNRLAVIGIAVEVGLLMILTFVPFLQHIFNLAPLPVVDYAIALVWVPVLIGLEEIRKWRLRVRLSRRY